MCWLLYGKLGYISYKPPSKQKHFKAHVISFSGKKTVFLVSNNN